MTVSFAFPLKPFETGTSYTSRLTRYLGHTSPYNLCTELGIDWPTVKRGDYHHLERLSEIGGADLQKLLHWSVRSLDGPRYKVCGEEVTKKAMTRTKLRVCPQCIAEDIAEGGTHAVFRRCYWQFYAIRTCKKHNAPLLQLPAEKHTILNFDIVEQVEKHFDQICREAKKNEVRKFTPFEAYLQMRLSSPRRVHFLDGFKLHVAAKLCETLGATMHFGTSKKMRDLTDDELHDAGKVGFKAAQSKQSLRKALAELWNEGDGQARHKSDIGHLYTWLTREPEHPDNSGLKDLISQIVFSTYPVRPGVTVFKRSCPRSVKFSFSTASEEFGTSHQRLARLAERAGLTKKCPDTKKLVLKEPMTRQRINGLLKIADHHVSRTQAIGFLGLDRAVFDSLVDHGLIHKVANDVDPGRCFRRGDLSWFVRDIRQKTRQEAEPGQCLITFEDLGSISNIPPAEILHAIMKGWLPGSVLPEKCQGLAELRFDECEIIKFLNERGVFSGLSRAEVATRLAIPEQFLGDLLGWSYLAYRDIFLWVNNTRHICGICPDSIREFEKKYISIGRLLGWNDIRRAQLIDRMTKMGISPILRGRSAPRFYDVDELKPREHELADNGISLKFDRQSGFEGS